MSNFIRWVCASVLVAWIAAALTMLLPIPSSDEINLQNNRDTLQAIIAERLTKKGIKPTPEQIDRETSEAIGRAKSGEWFTWAIALAVIVSGASSAVGAMRTWRRWRWPLAVTSCL